MNSAAATKTNRTARKRERTRDALLTAMQVVVLEKGYEKTTINDITEHADVGMGTFYNYFDTKAEVLAETADLILRSYHLDVDQVTAALVDPAERYVASILYTFKMFCDEGGLGKLLFECGIPLELYAGNIRDRALSDMQAGIDAGRFHVNDLMITLNMITGSTLYSGADLHFGLMPTSAIPKIIENVLLLVGIDHDEATRLAAIDFALPAPAAIPVSLLAVEEREQANLTSS
tara:strand:- start:249 stop:947 length:699 start_codon:yes stop_codon:yes gene_type:complete